MSPKKKKKPHEKDWDGPITQFSLPQVARLFVPDEDDDIDDDYVAPTADQIQNLQNAIGWELGFITDTLDADSVLHLIPDHWHHLAEADQSIAKNMTVAAIVLGHRLANVGNCVGSLAECFILDEVIFAVQEAEQFPNDPRGYDPSDLPEHWAEFIEAAFFDDLDHRAFIGPEHDGIADDEMGQWLGVAPMDYKNLFDPYYAEVKHPYIQY